MANSIYVTIKGKLQGLISQGCSTLDSIGNKFIKYLYYNLIIEFYLCAFFVIIILNFLLSFSMILFYK
ncbi:hypothetical protein Xenpb_02004 [Xenorhabdus sp. PB62.4]|nr:hypothetical protein [Xenorhabdus sp. PB62.4]